MPSLKPHAKRFIKENQNTWSCFTLKRGIPHFVSYSILQITIAMGFLV